MFNPKEDQYTWNDETFQINEKFDERKVDISQVDDTSIDEVRITDVETDLSNCMSNLCMDIDEIKLTSTEKY